MFDKTQKVMNAAVWATHEHVLILGGVSQQEDDEPVDTDRVYHIDLKYKIVDIL